MSSVAHPPETLRDSVGLVRTHQATLFEPPDELRLECGRSLGPIQVAYETYGQLSPQRDNAVLVCHALTGDAHAAGYHAPDDKRPGWWDVMIGPGKGIDTNSYFVICANVLGGCKGTTGPSSLNPATDRPWGLDFPVITIEDMVKVQKGLLEHLGIERLLAVVGGSMGGMQVLEWTVRYPESVAAAIAIATTPRLNAQSIAFDAVGRNAILADPDFVHGQYHAGSLPDRGLSIARMVGHITYLSEEGMHRKFGRQLRNADRYRYDFTNEFSVETYLDHQGRAFVERFDANSYLYITKAMDYYDLTARNGSLEAATRDVQAKVHVISFCSDWLFTPAQSRQIVDALHSNGKAVTYCNIDSPYGHDAFLLEPERVGRLIRAHLAAAPADWPETDATVNGDVGDRSSLVELRADHRRIEELIRPQSRVLDLGCGGGALLDSLRGAKRVRGKGVELDADAVIECCERGLSVTHGDLEHELPRLADSSYDYVVLSKTLRALRHPGRVLEEMLRVGRVAVVSFENGAHWSRRLRMVLRGHSAPEDLGCCSWRDTPNLRELSLENLERFCRRGNIRILSCIALSKGKAVRAWPNLRASEVILALTRSGEGFLP
ncbi:MAG: homoserine O-acetyltransferase [bacterium]|nr:homoserine O-acetyltransferase [bacterium]